MIIDSQDFIKTLEKIGGNKDALLFLADRFIGDHTPEEKHKDLIINFPDDKTPVSEYTIFFRLDTSMEQLTIMLVKDVLDGSISETDGFLYSDFYNVINKLGH